MRETSASGENKSQHFCSCLSFDQPSWTAQDALTVREFFKFPSPVDAIESRLHAMTLLFSVSAALLSILLGFPWLWLYLTYGFLARSLCGPRVDPQVSWATRDFSVVSGRCLDWAVACSYVHTSVVHSLSRFRFHSAPLARTNLLGGADSELSPLTVTTPTYRRLSSCCSSFAPW